MKPFSLMLLAFLHILVPFAFNSLWFIGSNTAAFAFASAANDNETDHLALLKLKESIYDPNGFLASWNSSTHFCKWHGITCNPMNQRVTVLKLEGHQLHGSISPYVGNLSFLRDLNLGNNIFHGEIPQELDRLAQLRNLVLTNNSLTGEFPTNLTSCSELRIIDLSGNSLNGKIPSEIGSHQKLRYLFIRSNKFTGLIPSSIGNLSSLIHLSLGYNNLEGRIPEEICRLKINLKVIAFHNNKFHGTLPSCLYNLSSLILISATMNQFSGYLPPNMFATLPNLRAFAIGGNRFLGPIPPSMTNASSLQVLDIAINHIIGQIPNLGKLKNLWFLGLSFNNLGSNSNKDSEFLEPLANCTTLRVLDVSYNNLGGRLSNSLGNLTTLNRLYLDGNRIYGKIPAAIGNLNNLSVLAMENNHFEGIIPADFGKLRKMQFLTLSGNKLLGDIPAFICNYTNLYFLNLSKNTFEGNIPPSIRNLQMLQYLDLSQNNLSGIIPIEVFSLPSFAGTLDLSQNSFNGSIPNEVGRLKNVIDFDLSDNRLSSDIPVTIGECTRLEYLVLKGNSFQGNIPSSLSSLTDLQYLDLSRNHLSGSIPEFLQNISTLKYLNVSFNMLDGEVPTEGVFRNANMSMVIGNGKLCGGISKLHLPPCPVKGTKPTKHHSLKLIAVIVCVVASILILSFILTIWWMRRRNKRPYFDSPTIDQLAMVSYQNLHHGTNGFSASNLIGSGSFGSVYEGTLPERDGVVAIKVLNLQRKGAHKSFIAECNALKTIRHRNLVKIVTCCSGIDYKGQEFKALVFEYMKNGSLEQWLHLRTTTGVEHQRTLDLDQRLNIIVDVASALHYLHHECEQPIIHCDLKPSNILLDDDMVAHVGDFGLARLVSTINGTSHKQSSTIGVKGTVGYTPPEYGIGSEVSTHGDMYSFGILILEILTGRGPTDETFEDGQNLHNFVEISFPNNILQILDPHLVPKDEEAEIEQENNGNLNPNLEKFLIPLFKIGLACSLESPKERMSMGDVTKELNQIKRLFPRGINGD